MPFTNSFSDSISDQPHGGVMRGRVSIHWNLFISLHGNFWVGLPILGSAQYLLYPIQTDNLRHKRISLNTWQWCVSDHQRSKWSRLISIMASNNEKKILKKCPKVTFRLENFFFAYAYDIKWTILHGPWKFRSIGRMGSNAPSERE